MRVILVNRFFFPDQSATAQLLTDLAEHLARQLGDVTVVTSRQLYERADAMLPSSEVARGVTILRVWTTSFGRSNPAGRALDYATFYVSALWRLLWLVRRRDIVVAKTDPPLLSVVGAIVAKLRGAHLVSWNQDVFPEIARAAGMRLALGFPGRVLIALRNWSWRLASCNVAVGAGMGEYLRELGISNARTDVIENWADGHLIRPLTRQQNALRTDWGLNDAFVVGYAGNLGVAHGTDAMLDAIKLLAEEPMIHFLFIGGGSGYRRLQTMVRRLGPRNVTFKGYVPTAQLPVSLTLPDVHLISLRPEMERFVVPSKLYGVLAAGRPSIFVGAEDGEVARVIKEFNCGRVVRPADGSALAACIRSLRADEELRATLGHNARLALERQFDKPLALKRWERLITRLGRVESSGTI